MVGRGPCTLVIEVAACKLNRGSGRVLGAVVALLRLASVGGDPSGAKRRDGAESLANAWRLDCYGPAQHIITMRPACLSFSMLPSHLAATSSRPAAAWIGAVSCSHGRPQPTTAAPKDGNVWEELADAQPSNSR